MSANSVALEALVEVLENLELYGRKSQVLQSVRMMDYNAAVFLLRTIQQQDNVLISRDTCPELAAPVRRNAYQLAQLESRIAELAYKSRKRVRTRPATHPTRPGLISRQVGQKNT